MEVFIQNKHSSCIFQPFWFFDSPSLRAKDLGRKVEPIYDAVDKRESPQTEI